MENAAATQEVRYVCTCPRGHTWTDSNVSPALSIVWMDKDGVEHERHVDTCLVCCVDALEAAYGHVTGVLTTP